MPGIRRHLSGTLGPNLSSCADLQHSFLSKSFPTFATEVCRHLRQSPANSANSEILNAFCGQAGSHSRVRCRCFWSTSTGCILASAPNIIACTFPLLCPSLVRKVTSRIEIALSALLLVTFCPHLAACYFEQIRCPQRDSSAPQKKHSGSQYAPALVLATFLFSLPPGYSVLLILNAPANQHATFHLHRHLPKFSYS